jgi:hypothetical protein
MSFLYYRRGDEWVRVDADAYSQVTSGSVGECPTLYDVYVTAICEYYPFNGSGTIQYLGHYTGQISGPLSEITFLIPGVLVGGMASFLVPGLDYARNGTPVGGLFGSDPLNTPKNRGNNLLTGPWEYQSITRVDGLPDDCGAGGCQTIFTAGGVEVLRLNECPEITDGRECSDCCREILPLLRAIRI